MNYLKYTVLLATGLCANNAMAFGSFGADVDQICAQASNSLEAQFQPAVNNNCTACHDDGNGGSGAGRTAYLNGETAIIDLFCPGAPTPEPTPEPPPAPEQTVCTDNDGDGFNAEGGNCGLMDCNDADFDIKPSATENCTDGIDNNCNNLTDAQDPNNAVGCPDAPVCTDNDGDDYAVEGGQCGPVDCDDRDSNVNPGERENCGDGFDNNCDANTDAVDATCQADEEEEDRRDRDEEEEDRRDHEEDRSDHEEDRSDHDDDDGDERRDSRRRGRGSRDRD
ncbi:MAG: MopE-related protein [Thiogranum sp.]